MPLCLRHLPVVVEKHIVCGNCLHNVVNVIHIVTVVLRVNQMSVGFRWRRARYVRFFVMPKKVMQRRKKLITARIILAVVGFQFGKVTGGVWRRHQYVVIVMSRVHEAKQAPSRIYKI